MVCIHFTLYIIFLNNWYYFYVDFLYVFEISIPTPSWLHLLQVSNDLLYYIIYGFLYRLNYSRSRIYLLIFHLYVKFLSYLFSYILNNNVIIFDIPTVNRRFRGNSVSVVTSHLHLDSSSFNHWPHEWTRVRDCAGRHKRHRRQ